MKMCLKCEIYKLLPIQCINEMITFIIIAKTNKKKLRTFKLQCKLYVYVLLLKTFNQGKAGFY